jgi:hypothetical protein
MTKFQAGEVGENTAAEMIGISPTALRQRRLRGTGPTPITVLYEWEGWDGAKRSEMRQLPKYKVEEVTRWINEREQMKTEFYSI